MAAGRWKLVVGILLVLGGLAVAGVGLVLKLASDGGGHSGVGGGLAGLGQAIGIVGLVAGGVMFVLGVVLAAQGPPDRAD